MNLEQLDKSYVLPTYARNYTNFVRGENSKLWDDKGKDYIDFTSGIAVCSVGHSNPRMANVIVEQAKSIIHISNLYAIEPQAKVAEKLAKLSGYDTQTFFANSGAEANEGAIKIARKYGEVDGEPKRYKVVTLEHSFHGRTITALKATGQEKMHTYFGPFPDGFVYAKSVEDIYSNLDDHTVAVMIELVQGEGGIEPFDKDEIQKLARNLKEKDILLIVDEVQTGIYRTGELLASNLYEIEPDIITLAKGLGGGVPIGAIMTTHKSILQPGDHGSTFGGNFLSTAVANEVLDILEEYKNSGELDHTIILFEKEMKKFVEQYPEVFEKAVGVGLMRGLRVKSAELLGQIVQNSHEEGLLVLKSGRNTLRFLPPLTLSKEELNEGFCRLDRALKRL